jgi:molybdate/tungstate transport system substrate-binding protein
MTVRSSVGAPGTASHVDGCVSIRRVPEPNAVTATSLRMPSQPFHTLRLHATGLRALRWVFGAVALAVAGCGGDDRGRMGTPLTVFAAGSLARPLRAALDSIAAAGGPIVRLEVMGSREIVRSIVSLGRSPDLVVSADADEVEARLLPLYVMTSTTFARNRVVLALSPKRRRGDSVTALNWASLVASGALRVARADPARAPLGFRTQLVWKLAELELQRAGLAKQLEAASPPALMRGNEADLVALLESGDADAAWCYESLARAMRLQFVMLGDQIDLGSPADSLTYGRVSVLVPGETPAEQIRVRGAPIRYAIAVVSNGGDVVAATLLRARLLDSTSARIMRRNGLDLLRTPQVVSATQALQLRQ